MYTLVGSFHSSKTSANANKNSKKSQSPVQPIRKATLLKTSNLKTSSTPSSPPNLEAHSSEARSAALEKEYVCSFDM